MLDAEGIATGLGVSFGDSWQFGPVRLTLSAWIAATASLSTRPAQLEGALGLGGEAAIAAGPFGLGLSVAAGLEGKSFAPYHVAGTLAVVVGLPFPLKDLDVDIKLEWTQPETPEIEDPWSGALVEHERCTESWTPVTGGSTAGLPDADAPVVPLDAGVLLTFAKPMGDDAPVADNPPASAPTEAIGDHTAAYALSRPAPAPAPPQPSRRGLDGRQRHGLRHVDPGRGRRRLAAAAARALAVRVHALDVAPLDRLVPRAADDLAVHAAAAGPAHLHRLGRLQGGHDAAAPLGAGGRDAQQRGAARGPGRGRRPRRSA